MLLLLSSNAWVTIPLAPTINAGESATTTPFSLTSNTLVLCSAKSHSAYAYVLSAKKDRAKSNFFKILLKIRAQPL